LRRPNPKGRLAVVPSKPIGSALRTYRQSLPGSHSTRRAVISIQPFRHSTAPTDFPYFDAPPIPASPTPTATAPTISRPGPRPTPRLQLRTAKRQQHPVSPTATTAQRERRKPPAPIPRAHCPANAPPPRCFRAGAETSRRPSRLGPPRHANPAFRPCGCRAPPRRA
jgi:hypothetical protein